MSAPHYAAFSCRDPQLMAELKRYRVDYHQTFDDTNPGGPFYTLLHYGAAHLCHGYDIPRMVRVEGRALLLGHAQNDFMRELRGSASCEYVTLRIPDGTYRGLQELRAWLNVYHPGSKVRLWTAETVLRMLVRAGLEMVRGRGASPQVVVNSPRVRIHLHEIRPHELAPAREPEGVLLGEAPSTNPLVFLDAIKERSAC